MLMLIRLVHENEPAFFVSMGDAGSHSSKVPGKREQTKNLFLCMPSARNFDLKGQIRNKNSTQNYIKLISLRTQRVKKALSYFSNTNITNQYKCYYVSQNRRQTESNQARLNCRGANRCQPMEQRVKSHACMSFSES